GPGDYSVETPAGLFACILRQPRPPAELLGESSGTPVQVARLSPGLRRRVLEPRCDLARLRQVPLGALDAVAGAHLEELGLTRCLRLRTPHRPFGLVEGIVGQFRLGPGPLELRGAPFSLEGKTVLESPQIRDAGL